jgi:hypothetical protein
MISYLLDKMLDSIIKRHIQIRQAVDLTGHTNMGELI